MSVSRAKVAVNLCLVGDVTLVFRSNISVYSSCANRIGGSIQGNRLSKGMLLNNCETTKQKIT